MTRNTQSVLRILGTLLALGVAVLCGCSSKVEVVSKKMHAAPEQAKANQITNQPERVKTNNFATDNDAQIDAKFYALIADAKRDIAAMSNANTVVECMLQELKNPNLTPEARRWIVTNRLARAMEILEGKHE